MIVMTVDVGNVSFVQHVKFELFVSLL